MLARKLLGNRVPEGAQGAGRVRSIAALYSAMARVHTVRETEIKIRISNLPALVERLRGLGAILRGRVLERNTLYDTPDSDLRLRGCLLRVRTETPAASEILPAGRPGAILTAKAPVPEGRPRGYKVKLEREAILPPAPDWNAALRGLGLRPAFCYEKYRATFRMPGLHLDLDETPVGVFLELEGAPERIDRFARALGCTARDYIQGTYWDLYAADCRRRGRKPGNMLFRPQKS